jgi:hypothetical protein
VVEAENSVAECRRRNRSGQSRDVEIAEIGVLERSRDRAGEFFEGSPLRFAPTAFDDVAHRRREHGGERAEHEEHEHDFQ